MLPAGVVTSPVRMSGCVVMLPAEAAGLNANRNASARIGSNLLDAAEEPRVMEKPGSNTSRTDSLRPLSCPMERVPEGRVREGSSPVSRSAEQGTLHEAGLVGRGLPSYLRRDAGLAGVSPHRSMTTEQVQPAQALPMDRSQTAGCSLTPCRQLGRRAYLPGSALRSLDYTIWSPRPCHHRGGGPAGFPHCGRADDPYRSPQLAASNSALE
jgi:hypothetical protein